ncbi:MAG: hypothetical protein QXS42_01935 [Zestosphaera sp.]
MRCGRAESDILATVVLIATTLILGVIVVGWVIGIWGSTGGPSESLTVTGTEAECITTQGVLSVRLTVNNKGTADAVVNKAYIPNLGAASLYEYNGQQVNGNTVTVSKGESGTLVVRAPYTGACPIEVTYQVNVYTQAGNVYTTMVKVAKSTTPS